jgi:AraC-like DNA-binding protein
VDTLKPAAVLRAWIADAAVIRPGGGTPLVTLPDAATALVYRRNPGGGGELRVVGPRSRASYHPDAKPPMCVRARLRPGAARRVLGVPAGELRDRSVALAALWGVRAARYERRLDALAGPDAILRGIEAVLREGLDAVPAAPDDRLLREAVAELSAPGARFALLAARLGVSERRLRDLFTRNVGLPPKHFARVARVRAVLDAHPAATGLAGVAADAGYYDQSHMTADFRALMGVPPAAFHAGRLPTPTPCEDV